MVSTPTIASDNGMISANAIAPNPAMNRVFSISSVAYATDERASEEKIASAVTLPRRSCTRCAVGIAGPRSARLMPVPRAGGIGGAPVRACGRGSVRVVPDIGILSSGAVRPL